MFDRWTKKPNEFEQLTNEGKSHLEYAVHEKSLNHELFDPEFKDSEQFQNASEISKHRVRNYIKKFNEYEEKAKALKKTTVTSMAMANKRNLGIYLVNQKSLNQELHSLRKHLLAYQKPVMESMTLSEAMFMISKSERIFDLFKYFELLLEHQGDVLVPTADLPEHKLKNDILTANYRSYQFRAMYAGFGLAYGFALMLDSRRPLNATWLAYSKLTKPSALVVFVGLIALTYYESKIRLPSVWAQLLCEYLIDNDTPSSIHLTRSLQLMYPYEPIIDKLNKEKLKLYGRSPTVDTYFQPYHSQEDYRKRFRYATSKTLTSFNYLEFSKDIE